MCVRPIPAVGFRAGKIELDEMHKKDLSNYDSIKLLAKQRFCDFLIEKKENHRIGSDWIVYRVLARRKWIKPNYIFGSELTTVHKSTPIEEVATKIYETSVRAANATREKALELAKAFIR